MCVFVVVVFVLVVVFVSGGGGGVAKRRLIGFSPSICKDMLLINLLGVGFQSDM